MDVSNGNKADESKISNRRFNNLINKMLNEYGNIEGFKKAYVTSLIEGNNIIPPYFRSKFICYLDINQPDYVCREKKEYMKLLEKIYITSGCLVINSENLESIMEQCLNNLKPREKDVIVKHFGLNGEIKTLEQIATEQNVTKEAIRQVEEKALTKLRNNKNRELLALCVGDVLDSKKEEEFVKEFFKHNSIFIDDEKEIDEDCQIILQRIIKRANADKKIRNANTDQMLKLSKVKIAKIINLAFPDGVSVKNLKYLSKRAKKRYNGPDNLNIDKIADYSSKIPKDILEAIYKQTTETEIAKAFRTKVKRINTTISNHPDPLIKSNPALTELEINERICKILESENITKLSDLLSYSVYELKQMENVNRNNIAEILLSLHRFGFSLEGESIEQEIVKLKLTREQADKLYIEELGFSTKTILGLKRVGINSLGDLVKYSKEDIKGIKNIGKKSLEEIIYIMASKGLKLKESNSKSSKTKKSSKNMEKGKEELAFIQKEAMEYQEPIEEEVHTEAYHKAMDLFVDFCNADNNEEQKQKIKKELYHLLNELDDCEKIKIRAKIYKQIENIGENRNQNNQKKEFIVPSGNVKICLIKVTDDTKDFFER